ncbi:MAG: PAS domain-containing protein, partial [Thermoplasmatota archaeon]
MGREIGKILVNYVEKEAPILYVVVDGDKDIIDMNAFASLLLGFDIVGNNLDDIFVDFDGSLDVDELIEESAQNRRLNVETKEDLPGTFEFSFYPVDGKTVVLGKPDVEKLERLRKEMVSLNNEFANLSRKLQKKNTEMMKKEEALESSFNGVVITNVHGDITYVNSYLLEMWGYEKKELLGENIEKLFEDREKYEKVRGSLDDGWSGEIKGEKKNGKVFDLQGSAAFIQKDGGMVFNLIDITSKKKVVDRRNLLNSLLRHDIKNKVQVVHGYLQLMENLQLPGEARDYLNKASECSPRLKPWGILYSYLV